MLFFKMAAPLPNDPVMVVKMDQMDKQEVETCQAKDERIQVVGYQ